MIFSRISQALNLETLASINSYRLLMEYMRCWMKGMKFEVCFLTYQRRLISGGLIFKLKHGISGKLLRLIKDFLSDRKKTSGLEWTTLLLDGCPSRSSSRIHTWTFILYSLD